MFQSLKVPRNPQLPTSLVHHGAFDRVYKFPALLNSRSRVSTSTLAAENVNGVEHHHVRSLGLFQVLMTTDFIE